MNERELLRVKKLLKEVNDLREQFGEASFEINFDNASAESLKSNFKELTALSEKYNAALDDANDKVGDLNAIIKANLQEMGKLSSAQKIYNSSLNKTANLSQKLSDDAMGISELRGKEVTNLVKQAKIQLARRAAIREELEYKKEVTESITKEEEKLLQRIKEEENVQDRLLKGAQARLKEEKKINKAMGLSGAAVKAVTTLLGKVGISADHFEGMSEDMREAAKSGSKLKVALAGVKGIAAGIGEALSDPLVVLGLFGKMLNAIFKGFKALVKLAGDFAGKAADVGKNFLGMSKDIISVRNNLNQAATSNFFMNFEEAMEHMKSINDLTGTAIQLSGKQLDTLNEMTQMYGLSQENAAKLFQFSTLMNQPLEDSVAQVSAITAELNASEGQMLNVNDVMEKFTNASAQARNNLGNSAKALAQASFQASKLGLSLSEIQSASEGTLNFQSSIEKEMKAEMLLGKELNLETLRRAALEGDVLTQGKEIERIIREQIKGTEGNVLKQRALAETLGISEEKMFAINDEMKLQDKLAKMGISKAVTLADYNKLAVKKQQELSREKGRNVSLDEAKLAISKDELKVLEEQSKAQQRVGRLVETLKETFINGLVKSGVLEKLNNLVAKLSDPKVLTPLVEKIENVAGKLGKFVMWALDNPGKAAGGVAAAFGAALLASKLIPQAVFVTGGKAFGKLGKTISKLFGKGGKKVATKAVMKNTGKVVTGAAAQSAVKAGTATATKTATKSVTKSATKAGTKAVTKTVGKTAAKTLGKSILKKIPGIGLLAGLYFAGEKLLEGDFAGAGLEAASGAASLIPGFGTAASIAIDAGIAARDISKATTPTPTPDTPPGGELRNDYVMERQEALQNKATSGDTASDFISRPGQPIQKFRKDDLIVGGTSLGSGGGEVVTLLKELIVAVKNGGDVYMDGAKVGKSLVLSSSRMG